MHTQVSILNYNLNLNLHHANWLEISRLFCTRRQQMVLNALSNRQLRELAILAQLFQEVLIERNGRKWIPLVESLRQHVDRATAVVTHAKNMSAEIHQKSP